MDTDWCLSCGHHVVDDAPYCSAECLNRDRPSASTPPLSFDANNMSSLQSLSDTGSSGADIIYHDIQHIPKGRWPGSDPRGIRMWAANIPLGSSDGTSSSDASRASSRASSPPPRRTPQLLLSNRRPAAASLCMSTPHPIFPSPSRPILTSKQSIASLNLTKSAGDVGSTSMSSLCSGITDSVIATPSSSGLVDNIYSEQDPKYHMPHMLDALATHVRSWVSPLPHTQPKHAPLHRASRPAALKLSKLTQSHVALHSDFDESGFDGYLAHDAWASSEGSIIEEETAAVKKQVSQNAQCQGQQSQRAEEKFGNDHPAYHARGRKVSRAFA